MTERRTPHWQNFHQIETVWQQPTDTSADHLKIDSTHKDFAIETTQRTLELTDTKQYDVANQTSPLKGIQPLSSVTATEQFQESHAGKGLVPFLNGPYSCPNDIQDSTKHIMTTHCGGNNILPLTITTRHIEQRLARDERTIEVYRQLTSTVVLKRRKEMLYVLLDFTNGLTKDALADSGAYVKAIAQNELDRIKQQAPNIVFKNDDPPKFQL